MKERLYDSLLFFFSRSLFPVLTIRRRLLPPHHHQLQDDQINAVYTNSIFFFPFFSSIRRPCSCGEAFVPIYTYRECIRVFSSSYEIADPNVHISTYIYTHIRGHQHLLHFSFVLRLHVFLSVDIRVCVLLLFWNYSR